MPVITLDELIASEIGLDHSQPSEFVPVVTKQCICDKSPLVIGGVTYRAYSPSCGAHGTREMIVQTKKSPATKTHTASKSRKSPLCRAN